MKLSFCGAAHEVTGSCHCIEACGKKILIDYGLEQGKDVYVNQPLPFHEAEVDYVFVTHAHIDHTGRLPLLYKMGFRGAIYATKATTELCNIMLKDSAHIQETEAEWKNRKARRGGRAEVEPLYDMEDAMGVLHHFVSYGYGEMIDVAEGIRIRFVDVGHLLGSSSIEVWLTEEGITKKLVFSGDIGNTDQPLIKNPTYIEEADYVVMESTYGDRSHGEVCDYEQRLVEVMTETFNKGGNVVIPCFAVGRTQEVLFHLRKIKESNSVPGFKNIEVYVDSPLAVEATHIFHKNIEECFDDEAMELVSKGINPITFKGLKLSVTSDDSKAINFDSHPKVILAASGMCEAGRIRHHLKHNLWRPESTILFAGYQAEGSLGRMLLDGVPEVRLFGETIQVHARIEKMQGISGHADQAGLIRWITSFKKKPKQVFVVHGDDETSEFFANLLQTEYGFAAKAPYSGASYDLITGNFLHDGVKEYTKKESAGQKKASSVFTRLLAAGHRLLAVIKKNEGGANKDLAKFADQINALSDKWDS